MLIRELTPQEIKYLAICKRMAAAIGVTEDDMGNTLCNYEDFSKTDWIIENAKGPYDFERAYEAAQSPGDQLKAAGAWKKIAESEGEPFARAYADFAKSELNIEQVTTPEAAKQVYESSTTTGDKLKALQLWENLSKTQVEKVVTFDEAAAACRSAPHKSDSWFGAISKMQEIAKSETN